MPYISTKKKKALKAKTIVSDAVRDNLLPHISEIKCHDCSNQAVHYHHDDYDKPLAVIPLCAQCHSNRHNKAQRTQYEQDANISQNLIIQRENSKEASSCSCRSFPIETLEERTKIEIAKHGTMLALARAINVNPGMLHRAKNGGNAPTLRKIWGIPKNPKRWRITIEADKDLFDLFMETCEEYDLTRRELLEDVLDIYRALRY